MTSEPIAVVGLSCRFPGAPSLAAYWDLLLSGRDVIRGVPKERWDAEAMFSPDLDAPGTVVTKWGSFLDSVGAFDPALFGISANEAERVDPQQRLMLELAWEALEDAAIAPDSLRGSDTAVYVGVSHSDYERIIYRELKGVCAHDGPGAYHALTANRVSFCLDLKGPSMVVDTACSSSLSALHVACQALRSHEVSLAIVGGVNLNLTPEETIGLTKARMMSPTGQCRTFDASADGYVRGEGGGAFILRRLSDALERGDVIRAIVRGSAINQNGMGNGVTAPNGPAQQAVVRRALRAAGVAPREIGYVETHGTGTRIGDPIEINALRSVLEEGRTPNEPCWLGSVKTNLGHLEAASGMASLIKVVLALRGEVIPRTLHFRSLNPWIRLGSSPIAIASEAVPWPRGERVRVAGVSAFGFGGSNAHVVIQEPSNARDDAMHCSGRAGEGELLPFVFSAHTETALRELLQRYAAALEGPALDPLDLSRTLIEGRSRLTHRAVFVAREIDELRSALISGSSIDGYHAERGASAPKVGLVVLTALDREPPASAWAGPDAAVWATLFKCRLKLSAAICVGHGAAALGLEMAGLPEGAWKPPCSDLPSALQTLRAFGMQLAIVTAGDTVRVCALSNATEPCLTALSASCRGRDGALRAVAELFARGCDLTLSPFLEGGGRRVPSLFTYPFQRSHHWVRPVRGDASPEVSTSELSIAGAP